MSNRDYVEQKLAEKGWNDAQIQGITANLAAENGTFDPARHESDTGGGLWDEGGYGIAQWTAPSRKQALANFAESTGGSVDSLDTQIDFLAQEISPNLLARMRDMSPEEAVKAVMLEYEAPADQSDDAIAGRQALIHGGGPAGAGLTPNQIADQASQGDLINPAYSEAYQEDLTNKQYTKQLDPTVDHPDVGTGLWDKFSTGFADTATNTLFANGLQLMWGGLAHTSHFAQQPVTQDDVDYVKGLLPNDKSAQEYVLLHARDREEMKWLINQKQVDAGREAKIKAWQDAGQSKMATFGSLAGELANPINYIGVGEASLAVKAAARLGSSIFDVGRAAQIAKGIGFVGDMATQGAITVADQYGSNVINRRDESAGNYLESAALAALTAGVLKGAGNAIGWGSKAMRSGLRDAEGKASHIVTDHTSLRDAPKADIMENISAKAEHGQDRAIEASMDKRYTNETKPMMSAVHDPSFAEGAKTPLFDKYVSEGRVKAVSYEDAKRIFKEQTAQDLPKETKAFYVPNEDYSVLIKDNVKPEQVEGVMLHEMGAHGDLKAIVGDAKYKEILDKVAGEAANEGSAFNQAMKLSGSRDPEEVLGYALENNLVKGKMMKVLTNRVVEAVRGTTGDMSFKMNTTEVKNMLLNHEGVDKVDLTEPYRNEDGTTAFGGVKFSKENPLNPSIYAPYLNDQAKNLEQMQGGAIIPKKAGKYLETGYFWGTPFGIMANSISKAIKDVGSKLVDDARMRGTGDVTMSAEAHKKMILAQLMKPMGDIIDARTAWKNKMKQVDGPHSDMEFNKLVMDKFNEKYGGHRKPIGEVEPEVAQAVEHLKRYRDMQVEIGKSSAEMIGEDSVGNLIDKDWKPTDEALWQNVDNHLVHNFIGRFDSFNQAFKFLENISIKSAKRDKIREGMIEDIRKENANRVANATEGEQPKLVKEEVSDSELEGYIKAAANGRAKKILNMEEDEITKVDRENVAELGRLKFLEKRLPTDTSMEFNYPDGTKFSFDNNLRDYKLDDIIFKNGNRFAGEAALSAKFGTHENLQATVARAKKELARAVQAGKMDKNREKAEWETLNNTIDRVRGFRENADVIGRMGTVARILRNVAYAKSGPMMILNQMAECSGAVAYGGLKQVLNAIPYLHNFIDKAKGGLSDSELKDCEMELFGRDLETEIWGTNTYDRVVRDALTEHGSVNDNLIKAADFTHTLGKVTSTVNDLPNLTDNMVRGMRRGFLGDSLRFARGEAFSRARNPFSDAKLKAANISKDEAERLKVMLAGASEVNADGLHTGFDWRSMQQADPALFAKWYNMANQHAERAIIAPNIGNSSVMKDSNSIMKTLLQFRDFSARAWNAQTLRAISSKDFDDGMAAALGIATNTMAYVANRGLFLGGVAAGSAALGANPQVLKDEAEKYFNPLTIAGAVAFRSSILGTPLGFVGQDIAPLLFNTGAIRSTTDVLKSKQKNQTLSDKVGDYVMSRPSIREAFGPFQAAAAAGHMLNGDATKGDMTDLMRLVNFNVAPLAGILKVLPETTTLPKKRPKS